MTRLYRTIPYGTVSFVFPDPRWPVIALALISVIDGVLCVRPAAFVVECYRRVEWPRRYWWLMPPIKFAAAAGLIAGLWIPALALVTTTCLVVYFVVAITGHIRAHDFSRYLFVNATGMLLICSATLTFCFLV